jgi:hypothetical protein
MCDLTEVNLFEKITRADTVQDIGHSCIVTHSVSVSLGSPRSFIHVHCSMALFSDLTALLWTYSAPLIFVLTLMRFVRNRYKPGLRQIPGPFLASISDLWNFAHVCLGHSTHEYELHQAYKSPLLRMGPNYVSCSDPESIRVIYGWKRVFQKVSMVQQCSKNVI